MEPRCTQRGQAETIGHKTPDGAMAALGLALIPALAEPSAPITRVAPWRGEQSGAASLRSGPWKGSDPAAPPEGSPHLNSPWAPCRGVGRVAPAPGLRTFDREGAARDERCEP